MDELKVDLSKQKFSDGIQLFQNSEVSLKHKNFIFARNGSGKSTFGSLIKSQYSENFDVRVYSGIDSVLGENEKLNAFALAVNAGKNEAAIKQKETELQNKKAILDTVKREIDDTNKQNLKTKLDSATSEKNQIAQSIEKFCTDSAAIIKKTTNPQISKTTYYKNDFKKEISKAKKLQKNDIGRLMDTLESQKSTVSSISWVRVNFLGFLKSTNEILASKVEEKRRIKRFHGDQRRINFAEEGLNLHRHEADEICAFCGNVIKEETFQELEAYFSADEVTTLKKRISVGKDKVKQLETRVNSIDWNQPQFFPEFQQDAEKIWEKLLSQRDLIIKFCANLMTSLDEKEKNLFVVQPILKETPPEDFDFSEYNKLVEINRKYDTELDAKKHDAQNQLRYNKIQELLDKFKYDVVDTQMKDAITAKDTVQSAFDSKVTQKEKIMADIQELYDEIDKLRPKAETQAVEHINTRLRGVVPWQLTYSEDEETGYYRVSQTVNGVVTYRGVKDLSTGEKNVIALLYFLEKLGDTASKRPRIPKIIIFDDPMNSNDSDMQYLIITELHRLYSGNQRERFDNQKDFLVIMTHNIHFYINVPPYGGYKDSLGKTKYDKCDFYHIRLGKFLRITNEKQDMQTNYDALWMELTDLAEHEYTNSMLNSMRRIIETYIEFTGIKKEDFYQNNEQYLKLFNVNSHTAIDSCSAQAFTKNASELVKIFYKIFADNHAEEHFMAHWRGDSEAIKN